VASEGVLYRNDTQVLDHMDNRQKGLDSNQVVLMDWSRTAILYRNDTSALVLGIDDPKGLDSNQMVLMAWSLTAILYHCDTSALDALPNPIVTPSCDRDEEVSSLSVVTLTPTEHPPSVMHPWPSLGC